MGLRLGALRERAHPGPGGGGEAQGPWGAERFALLLKEKVTQAQGTWALGRRLRISEGLRGKAQAMEGPERVSGLRQESLLGQCVLGGGGWTS